MADGGYILSRNEQMIRAIIDGTSYSTGYIQSRNEKILQAIIDGTSYDAEPQSRIEALLLHILNGTHTDVVPLSRNEAILTAIANGTEYTEEPQSRMEELLIEWLESRQAVEKTASGAIASFTTVLAEPLIKCICAFMATQDLHGQDKPYPAGGGKNLFGVASATYSGLSITVQSDGSVLVNGTADANHSFPVSVKVKAGSYVLSCAFTGTLPSTTTGRVTIYEGSTYVTGITNNAATTREMQVSFENDTTITCNIRVDGNFNYQNVVLYPQLELGSSASAFAPYENVCPIVPVSSVDVTRTGKNLIDNTAFRTYSNWKDDLTNNPSVPTQNNNRGYLLNLKVGVTYMLSFGITSETFPKYLYLCKDNGTTSTRYAMFTSSSFNVDKFTFTADDSMYYIRIGDTMNQTAFDTQMSKIAFAQLEVGNQATDYEAFNGVSDNVALGASYYGGNVDVVDGKITATHLRVKMSDLTWIGSNGIFENRTSSEDLHTATRGTPTMCSIYQSSGNASSANMLDKSIQTMGGAGSSNFWVKDTDYATKEAFIASLGNAEIVYELAEPTQATTSDTATLNTLQGQNNVFNNTGNTEVTYLDKP